MENRSDERSGGGSWLMLTLMTVGVIALYLLFPPKPF